MNATFPAATAPAPDLTATLDASDRCDRCGARALVRAVLPNGLDLLFCGHHAREYDAALKAKEITLKESAEAALRESAT